MRAASELLNSQGFEPQQLEEAAIHIDGIIIGETGWGVDWEFSIAHVEFEMLISHSSGGVA